MSVQRLALCILLAAICVLVVSTGDAGAQVTNGRSQVCNGRSCQIGYFSAVGIGKDSKGRTIFVTCAHCVEGAGRVSLGLDAKWVDVTVIGTGNTQSVDVAVLASDVAMPCCAPLAAQSPGVNEKVSIRAFPFGRQFAIRETTVASSDAQSLWVASPFVQGESGGAVIKDKQVVGIVSSTPADGYTGLPSGRGPGRAVPVEVVRGFVKRILGEVPVCECAKKPEAAAPPPPTEAEPPVATKPPESTGGTNIEQRVTALETGVRELTIRVQRIEGTQQSTAKEIELIRKSLESIEKTAKETQLATQNQRVEIQRVSKDVETIKQMAGKIGFKVRLDQSTGKYSLVPEGQ